MIIEGPIRVSAESSGDGSGFGLHLSFVEEFQALEKAQQDKGFAAYPERLRAQSAALDEVDPNRQGMLIVLQVGEQLLPLIREGSLLLSKKLEIEIDQQAPPESFPADPSSRAN